MSGNYKNLALASSFERYQESNSSNINGNINGKRNGLNQEVSQYVLNTTHPLIPNANEYVLYKQQISIHSEDRDILRFPESSQFEIQLPQDYLNVVSIRLVNWTFPANYNTFSALYSNISLTFQINNPYNPGANNLPSDLQNAIFQALYANVGKNFIIYIEEGFYTPNQMATELTNKMNFAVSSYIDTYFIDNGISSTIIAAFAAAGGYTDFINVYNAVSQKIWFGNRSSGFILTNSFQVRKDLALDNIKCSVRNQVPDFSDWGLPGNLGLTRCDTNSIATSNIAAARFYYGDVTAGDNGYWLLPNTDLSGSQIHFVECPFKINLMGPAYFYMELSSGGTTLNCIDETAPYNISKFTVHTNQTNGVVNSSFAKIAMPTTPIARARSRKATATMPPASARSRKGSAG